MKFERLTSPSFTSLGAVILTAGFAMACSGADGSADTTADPNTGVSNPTTGEQIPVPTTQGEFVPTAEQTLQYMRFLSPSLVGRVLSDAEEQQIMASAGDAVAPMLQVWTTEEGFAEAARVMMETRLGTSGTRGGIDYELPGNIVEFVVRSNAPWSQILTSQSCYDAALSPIACDTGAPYNAGVLATKGYTAGNESRFNLSRAKAMIETFACRDYPQEDALQPRIEKDRLLVMFRAQNQEEQQIAEAAGGFGNGFACYTCHGQFSLHAQLFVKFDRSGTYIPEADGQQNPDAQLGESYDGLSTSHMINPTEAASETSQIFGTPVANLAEAAAVIAQNPVFTQCTVQHLLDHGLGLDRSYESLGPDGVPLNGVKVDVGFLGEITDTVKAANPDPPLSTLAVQLFSDFRVMAITLNDLNAR